MSIVINTNVPALMAAHHVRKTRDGLETAMERLASGSRINSAGDDAAGAGIANRLEAQVRGANMAMRNVQDAISLVEVADAAYVEVEAMLTRMYELAVQQTSTGTVLANDIANIQAERQQLANEIQAIAVNTKFNNTALNTGSGYSLVVASEADGTTSTFTLPTFLNSGTTGVSSTASVANVLTAIDKVSTDRGTLASFLNRMEYKVNNLSAVSSATSAAQSRIEDTDYAAESANVAKFQVLQQAGAAMLAQANASSQYVLTLLQ